MYSQLLPFPKQNLYNPPSNQCQKLPVTLKLKAGFFNLSNKVSLSRLSSRRCDRMALTVYGGQHIAQEQKQEDKHDDGYYMRRCVELAKKAIGCTSPNPMVGCVIVKDGAIVGEGFHPKAGQPHAEVFALRNAGDLAKDGIAYVSLEPCNHQGRTPPCTEALIKANVRKVVVGMVDPNPIVASSGVKKLQDAGVEVIVGVEQEMCIRLNEAYIHRMLTGKPFVTLRMDERADGTFDQTLGGLVAKVFWGAKLTNRYSISIDGHFLNKLGEEAMELDGYYSKLLQEYDAIVLSSTSITDTSIPMSKQPGAKQPLKIVLSKRPDFEKNTCTEQETSREGIRMVPFDKIRLAEILHTCKTQGFCSVLVDLKGNHVDFEDILKEGLEENLIQKLVVEVLPVLGGGHESVLNFMDLNAEVKNLTSRVSGKSVLLEGYL